MGDAISNEARRLGPAVEARVRQERPWTPIDALDHDQRGDSKLFIPLVKDQLTFDHSLGRWFQYGGVSWAEDRDGAALAALDRVADLYEAEHKRQSDAASRLARAGDKEGSDKAAKAASAIRTRLKALGRDYWRRGALTFAASGPGSLGLTGDGWDSNPDLLACQNGVLELRRTEDGPLVFFRPGRAADYIKTAIPTPWPEDPPAEGKLYGPADLFALIDAPRFIRFVQEIFDNNLDLAVYAWRILGYAIEGRPVEDILPLFCGPGRNGKTTLLELLMDVLGPLAGPIKSEMMLKQRQARSSAAPDSDVVGLRGKRLVWASETDEGRRLNAGRVKWLTGGDTLVGRPPHGRHEITFSPSHTLILSTNNLPRADARDRALWARIRVIPFKLAFVGNPQGPHERQADPDLLEKLKAEAPGILAWLVAGWVAYRTRGLDPPEEVTKATDDYREDEDVIGQFISECCILDETARVLAKDLYQEFKQWADDQGIQPVGRVIFGRYLGDTLGLDFITPGNRKKYLGIGLLATELPGAG